MANQEIPHSEERGKSLTWLVSILNLRLFGKIKILSMDEFKLTQSEDEVNRIGEKD
jgi:hypothetical protein